MANSEFSDHQAWSELVSDKRPRPSLKKIAAKLREEPPDFEAERDEILRQQPMTD